MLKQISCIFILLIPIKIFSQTEIIVGDSGINQVFGISNSGSFTSSYDNNINTPRGMEIDQYEEKLYYINASNQEIRILDLATGVQSSIFIGEDMSDLCIDPINSYIYYSNKTDSSIDRINMDGSNRIQIITGLSDPIGIEIDMIRQILFFGDDTELKKLDINNGLVTVISSGYNRVHRIALNLHKQNIFFTDRNSVSTIYCCTYSGLRVRTIASVNSFTSGIDIDHSDERLYWLGSDKTLECSELNGNNRIVVNSSLDVPADLVINSNCIQYAYNTSPPINNIDNIQTTNFIYANTDISSASFVKYESNCLILENGFICDKNTVLELIINPCKNQFNKQI